MYQQLKTERLQIRPIQPEDKDFILEMLNTYSWLQFIGDRNVKSAADAEKYIHNILSNCNSYYSIFQLQETKQPIGIITFLYRKQHKFPDIGFAMLPQFEKNGYAFEACKRYLDEVKHEKLTSKVIVIVLPENKNSIRLLTRLGLNFEHTLVEDHQTLHLYGLAFHPEKGK